MENFTVPVPNGTTNHGNPNLICTPASFSSMFIFFATNFFAHAVTVKQLPGEELTQCFFAVLAAVFYPYCGLPRGVQSIMRRAIFSRDSELQTAGRAGALCIVVRSRLWKPARGQLPISGVYLPPIEKESNDRESEIVLPIDLNGEELGVIATSSPEAAKIPLRVTHDNLVHLKLPRPSESIKGRKIHGVTSLPDGYGHAILRDNTRIVPNADVDPQKVHISSSYNLAQVIVSLVQLVSSSITLYRARGDQLNRYGYAAFGLTVLPYVTMSIVNLIGNILTPNYQSVYLVNSTELEEAKTRGGDFDGTVGKIVQPHSWTAEGNHSGIASFHSEDDSERFTVTVRSLNSEVNETGEVWGLEELMKWEDEDGRPAKDHGKFPCMDILSKPTPKRCLEIPRCSPFEILGDTNSYDPPYSPLIYIFFVIPYVTIGGLTHFHKGGSTTAQRAWIMIWLVFNTLFAFWAGIPDRKWHDDRRGFIIMLVLAAPGIGGFVVVGQMLKNYGNCIDIGSGI